MHGIVRAPSREGLIVRVQQGFSCQQQVALADQDMILLLDGGQSQTCFAWRRGWDPPRLYIAKSPLTHNKFAIETMEKYAAQSRGNAGTGTQWVGTQIQRPEAGQVA